MHALAEAALDVIRRIEGVDYADCRVVEQERESIHVRGDAVDRLDRKESAGIGVRVMWGGAWGFAAQPGTTEGDAVAAARAALVVARASAGRQKERIRLTEEEPASGSWSTPVALDPFRVPLARKLAELGQAVRVLGADAPGAQILSAEAKMAWRRETKWFASTEGGRYQQSTTNGGAGLKIVVAGGEEIATRTWPMDLDGGVGGAGYEVVERLRLADHAGRIREEALALLGAEPCPAGPATLILDTPQLALQIHESCGHATESDRALGEEISLAGASFLTPDKLGRFRYGATHVNLTADSTVPGGTGTFGWDDEGVASRRTPLVARGVFVGYLSSRETAMRLGVARSAGCMRAESWSKPPIVRMINVSLDPDPNGPASLDELIADTPDGILMTTNRSWSIDDLRLNFQFGCEAAWKIEHGKRGAILKRPVYTGITPRFWAGCDAIGAPSAWQLWGFVSCGKGDPIQLMAVGHGCAPARFRGVDVGSAR